MRCISQRDYAEQRWKNGGGLTHEIVACFSEEPAPHVLWRISIATIERDGPFSDFRGYDRTIVAIGGDPVELDVDAERQILCRFEPFVFAGEARVSCRLTGGVARDLNVMTLRDRFAHRLEIVHAFQRISIEEDEVVAIVALDGDVHLDGVRCASGDALHITGAQKGDLHVERTAAVIRIQPR
jgi:environmental stress-induced protein Ves